MSGHKMPRFELNESIVSKIIAEVVESNNEQFGKGDFVTGYLNWQEYQVADGTGLSRVNPNTATLRAHLGVLGFTGLTAYFALSAIGKPKPGETLAGSGDAAAFGETGGQVG